jgi:membrane protease YdiL (CAAX protease family)
MQLSQENDPFKKINILRLLVSLYITLPVLLVLILGIFGLLNNLKLPDLMESPTVTIVLSLFYAVGFGYILFRASKKTGLIFNYFIGEKRQINLKLITLITILIFAFSRGFNSLFLYGLSFIFPEYIEKYLNTKDFTNLPEMFALSFLSMFLAPLIEEFFFRGIVLQKWTIKWGVNTGILTSSLLFAIIHFRFDIISLFFGGIILSVLYFKTRSLIAPILCHFLYNTIGAFFVIKGYFSPSIIETNTLISIKDYQASVQPLLGQRVFLIAISVPFLIYFVSKNFPRNDAIIPYYANDSKISETN